MEPTTSTQMIAFVEARLREARVLAEAAAADWEPAAYTYDEPSAEFIRRHDPHWALADIAAKEEIVRQYKEMYRMREGVADDFRPELKAWLEGLRMAVLEIAKLDKAHPDFDGLWQIYFLGLE